MLFCNGDKELLTNTQISKLPCPLFLVVAGPSVCISVDTPRVVDGAYIIFIVRDVNNN